MLQRSSCRVPGRRYVGIAEALFPCNGGAIPATRLARLSPGEPSGLCFAYLGRLTGSVAALVLSGPPPCGLGGGLPGA